MGKRLSLVTVLVLSLVAPAIAAPTFNNKSVKGSYTFGFSGTILPSGPGIAGPIAGNGVLTADGKGNLQGSEVFNDNGTVCTGTLSGTYSINSDGTGSATLNFTNGPSSPCADAVVHESLSLSASQKLLHFTSTDANAVFSGTEEKQ